MNKGGGNPLPNSQQIAAGQTGIYLGLSQWFSTLSEYEKLWRALFKKNKKKQTKNP